MPEPPHEYRNGGPFDSPPAGQEQDQTIQESVTDAPTIVAKNKQWRRRLGPHGAEETPGLPGPTGRASVASSEQASRASLSASPVEAMWLDELARTRIFLKVIIGIGCAVLVVYPFLGGELIARRIMLGGVVSAIIAAWWLIHDLRKPENYNLSRLLTGGVLMGTCAWTGVFYFGVFSPAPGIFVLGLYYFSLGAASTATLVVYLTVAGLQMVSSTAIELDWIRDPGLVKAYDVSANERMAMQFLVQILLLSAFVMARLQRRNTLQSVERLERAVRQVSQREALLREARQDLDRALRVGGPGRFSDQTIGSFHLGMLIGRGGMGEVYEAEHIESKELAAVKLLSPQALANPDYVTRFIREAGVAASLNVPYVVRVLEVGRTDGNVPYLAMERLRGRDLAGHLRRKRRLPIGKVISLVEQVGIGLAAAREAGIVHRDLKPQNLFLAEQDEAESVWKILDFGVSKLAGQGGTLTRGAVVGTPGYMAPEQARGENVDHRADLYSLAVIAYRALTGHPAFSGRDVPSTLYDVVYKMPVRPSMLVSLPPELDLVLAIGMAKEPTQRFSSGADLAAALQAVADRNLDPRIASHGRDILTKMPWSTSVGRMS